MKNKIFLYLVSTIFFFGCQKNNELKNVKEYSLPPLGTIIFKENVVQLDNKSNLTLFSLDSQKLTYRNPTHQLRTAKEGDILIGSPNLFAPNGYIRKIISITDSNSDLIYQTQQATFEDVIEQCNIVEILQFDGLRGFNVSSEINVLIDKDRNENTINDQIRFEGSFDIKPRIIFELTRIKSSKIEARVGATIETNKIFRAQVPVVGFSTGTKPVEKRFYSIRGNPMLVGGFFLGHSKI